MTTDTKLKRFIQDQTDKALRGVKVFKSFKLLKGDLTKSRCDKVKGFILQYDTNRAQFVHLVSEQSSHAKYNYYLHDLDEIAPNFKDYAYWLQEELYNLTIDNREKHEFTLVDERAIITHILAQITILIAETCHETSYVKASDQTHQEALQSKRQKVVDTIIAQKKFPRSVAEAIYPFFQPEEESNLIQIASNLIPLTDEQKSWVDKKLKTGKENQKKPLTNVLHAVMQPFSLALVVASTFFTPIWRITLANYLACITFFTPNPLKPIQYRILNQERELDRRIVLGLIFITLFISSWALLQFVAQISTLSAIKAVAAIGIGCIAVNKLLVTTKEIQQSNKPFWDKAGILVAEYLINGLALTCVAMTFIGPQYMVFSEIIFAWYSVDLCLGAINLIPGLTDRHSSRTLWTSLTFSSVAYIAALATGQITLMELYIATAVTFAAITRIASTYNIEPIITDTCARHASYLWLCWLTLENRLPLLPTRIGLAINLAVEILCACYDGWKNRRYGHILDAKISQLDKIKIESDNAEKSFDLRTAEQGWYGEANTDVTHEDDHEQIMFPNQSDEEMETLSLGSDGSYQNIDSDSESEYITGDRTVGRFDHDGSMCV